jgi:chromosome segregation ATPase
MTKRKLRKNADISPTQSPHDGIHTCSKGCKKPGCTRTLRDTIEEQDQQIEALKRDVLEKTTELRNLKEVVHDLRISAEDDLDTIETAREEIARLQEENARLKAEVERLTAENESLQTKATNIYNAMVVEWKVEQITHKANTDSIISQGMMSEAMKLVEESIATKEQVQRLRNAGDELRDSLPYIVDERLEDKTLRKIMNRWNAAKEGKQQ